MQWNAETEKSKSTSIKQIGKATYVLRVTCKQVQQNKLQFPRKSGKSYNFMVYITNWETRVNNNTGMHIPGLLHSQNHKA